MPRKIDVISRERKRDTIKKNVSKKLFDVLVNLEENYNKNYGIKFFDDL